MLRKEARMSGMQQVLTAGPPVSVGGPTRATFVAVVGVLASPLLIVLGEGRGYRRAYRDEVTH